VTTAGLPEATSLGRTWGSRFLAVPIHSFGAVAQLGERLHGMQEVTGSIPVSSTKILSDSKCFLTRLRHVPLLCRERPAD
jgi:hypothetical protein